MQRDEGDFWNIETDRALQGPSKEQLAYLDIQLAGLVLEDETPPAADSEIASSSTVMGSSVQPEEIRVEGLQEIAVLQRDRPEEEVARVTNAAPNGAVPKTLGESGLAYQCWKSPITPAHIRKKCGNGRAPNCFGHPRLNEPTSEDCKKCEFIHQCGQVARDEAPNLIAHNKLFLDQSNLIGIRSAPFVNLAEAASWRALLRRWHIQRAERSIRRRRENDRTGKQVLRHSGSPEAKIEVAYRCRLNMLKGAVGFGPEDKRLQQLRGREVEITTFWKNCELAKLVNGPKPSDSQIATFISNRTGSPLSRHQARNYRILVQKLERAENVWADLIRRIPIAPQEVPA